MPPPNAPYDDLVTAGRELAARLEAYRDANDVLILAIVRGGIPAGIEVAAHLRLPLDVILREALFATPEGEGIGVTSVAGTRILDPRIAEPPPNPDSPRDIFLGDALARFDERVLACRGDRPPVRVEGKRIVVVDNGMRTGGTMRWAVRAVRALGAAQIIAASPVGTPEIRASIEGVADEVVCPIWQPLGNVAMAYRRFVVPLDAEIARLLGSYGNATSAS